MGKGGWIALLVSVGLLALAVLFLLSQAKGGGSVADRGDPVAGAPAKTGSARPPAPDPSRASLPPSAAKPVAEDDGEPTVDPRTGDVRTIKTTPEGRTYVEIIHPDGSRKRDFRSSAVRSLRNQHRLSKGPRLLEAKNAMELKTASRPPVWACMRKNFDALAALPGAEPNPSVAVFAHTNVSDGKVSITSVEVQADADAQDPALASCIEEALANVSVPVDPASDQKPYEDFEVGMRFRLPGRAAAGGRAPAP